MSITKTVETWFTAADGTRFQSEDKAREYQEISDLTQLAMKLLKPAPVDSCGFANSGDYIQQDIGALRTVRAKLWDLTRRIPHMRDMMARHAVEMDPRTIHPSWPLRFLDGSHKTLERAWGRLWATDLNTGREYGQPFYASNPKPDAREIQP